MDIDTGVFRPAGFIELALRNLTQSVLIGLVLVLLVLAGFLFDWRTTLICLVTIPLSLVAAGLVVNATGGTLNMMVVTGFLVAIGIVLFDAISSVENVLRRLRQARTEAKILPTAGVVLEAMFEARGGMIYATLILILAVAPVYLMGGLPGAFYRPLVLSYALAAVASMIVAATVTPALCLLLLRNPRSVRHASPFADRLRRAYGHRIEGLIPRGRVGFAVVAVLGVLGLVMVPFTKRSALPNFEERNIVVHLNCLPGTSQPEMSRITGRICTELQSIPGVHEVGAHIGRAVLGDRSVDVETAELWVNIDPDAKYASTCANIQRVVDGYPGVNHHVQTYLREKSENVEAGPVDDITVRVYGETEPGLRDRAQEVQQTLTQVHGVVDSKIRYPVQQAGLEAEVDIAAARRYGLTPGDVRRGRRHAARRYSRRQPL
jgi:Cu/Ag efflux pump CusA